VIRAEDVVSAAVREVMELRVQLAAANARIVDLEVARKRDHEYLVSTRDAANARADEADRAYVNYRDDAEECIAEARAHAARWKALARKLYAEDLEFNTPAIGWRRHAAALAARDAAQTERDALRAELAAVRAERDTLMSTTLSGTGASPELETWRDKQLAEVAAKYGKGSEIYRLKAELLDCDRKHFGALRERNALRAALERYGEHDPPWEGDGVGERVPCAVWHDSPCTCGLDAALKGTGEG
jgi:hypothetical protein